MDVEYLDPNGRRQRTTLLKCSRLNFERIALLAASCSFNTFHVGTESEGTGSSALAAIVL